MQRFRAAIEAKRRRCDGREPGRRRGVPQSRPCSSQYRGPARRVGHLLRCAMRVFPRVSLHRRMLAKRQRHSTRVRGARLVTRRSRGSISEPSTAMGLVSHLTVFVRPLVGDDWRSPKRWQAENRGHPARLDPRWDRPRSARLHDRSDADRLGRHGRRGRRRDPRLRSPSNPDFQVRATSCCFPTPSTPGDATPVDLRKFRSCVRRTILESTISACAWDRPRRCGAAVQPTSSSASGFELEETVVLTTSTPTASTRTRVRRHDAPDSSRISTGRRPLRSRSRTMTEDVWRQTLPRSRCAR